MGDRPLVVDELVKFEKQPIKVQDFQDQVINLKVYVKFISNLRKIRIS